MASAALAVSVAATDTPDPGLATLGKDLYKAHCVSCHGASGRGDGARALHLRYPPSDLTVIAAFNEGRFPAVRVRRIVDGRDPVKGHLAGGDMPIWGDALKDPAEGYAEARVQRRLDALVQYIASIQRSQEQP